MHSIGGDIKNFEVAKAFSTSIQIHALTIIFKFIGGLLVGHELNRDLHC